jgi:hypothetical protein
MGDSFFEKGDFLGAKVAYQSALSYFPGEMYPRDQIKRCDQFLDKK